jgi:hypothetical protein
MGRGTGRLGRSCCTMFAEFLAMRPRCAIRSCLTLILGVGEVTCLSPESVLEPGDRSPGDDRGAGTLGIFNIVDSLLPDFEECV